MGDHDHKVVTGYFPQELHDLLAGLAVKGAGGFVRQHDGRIVDEGAGDGHALHLPAGKLGRALVHLIHQADAVKLLGRPALTLLAADAGKGQRQFHVAQQSLVRDQVVALEDKAHAVIAVGVPVAALVPVCRDAVDDHLAGVAVIQPADNVEQRRFPGPAGAQDGHELIFPERKRYAVQSFLDKRTGSVFFVYVIDLKHRVLTYGWLEDLCLGLCLDSFLFDSFGLALENRFCGLSLLFAGAEMRFDIGGGVVRDLSYVLNEFLRAAIVFVCLHLRFPFALALFLCSVHVVNNAGHLVYDHIHMVRDLLLQIGVGLVMAACGSAGAEREQNREQP